MSVRPNLGTARRVLVTGGMGNLARALAASDWPSGYEIFTPSRQALDICDRAQVEEVIKTLAPAVVINAAAYTRVDLAERAEPKDLAVNDLGCDILSKATVRSGAKLLHVSTDFVFSGTLGRPYRETDATGPRSAYGMSKLRGEDHILHNDPDAVVARTSWLMSGRSGFIPAILSRALQGRELGVVADQFGTPTDVDDLAGALKDVAVRLSEEGVSRNLYHVAGPAVATWHELAEAAVQAWARLTGQTAPTVRRLSSAEWTADAARPIDSQLDSTAFREDFGYDLPSWRARVADWVMAFERGRA